MPRTTAAILTMSATLLAGLALAASSWQADAMPQGFGPPGSHAVDAAKLFGLQAIPKFDEKNGRGAWGGSRTRGLAMYQDLGVQLTREGFLWGHFEPKPGTYTHWDFDDAVKKPATAGMAIVAMVTETPVWASSRAAGTKGIDPRKAPPRGLALPTFSDGTDVPAPGKAINPENLWAAGLDHMVARYGDRVTGWQIWNEPDYPSGATEACDPDGKRSWTGSATEYARLLRVSRAVVRARRPEAQILTGGLGHAAYLEAILAAGAAPDFDAVDFHAYGWPGSETAVAAFVKVHDEMKAVLVRHGLGGRALTCSETGYAAKEPATQAAFLGKVFPTALAIGVSQVMIYAPTNPCWHDMGLVDWQTMQKKTAGYAAYRTAAIALRDVNHVTPWLVGEARGYRFTRQGAPPVAVLWVPGAKSPMAVAVAPGGDRWQLRGVAGDAVGQLVGGRGNVGVDDSPLWFDADLGRPYAAPQGLSK